MLEHFRRLLAPGGVAYVSTPNVLTLAPEGAEKSGNPWHVREYRAAEFGHAVPIGVRPGRAAGPLPRTQAAGRTSSRCRSGGTRSTRGSGSRSRSTTGSRPRSRSRDFALRASGLDRALDFLAVCRELSQDPAGARMSERLKRFLLGDPERISGGRLRDDHGDGGAGGRREGQSAPALAAARARGRDRPGPMARARLCATASGRASSSAAASRSPSCSRSRVTSTRSWPRRCCRWSRSRFGATHVIPERSAVLLALWLGVVMLTAQGIQVREARAAAAPGPRSSRSRPTSGSDSGWWPSRCGSRTRERRARVSCTSSWSRRQALDRGRDARRARGQGTDLAGGGSSRQPVDGAAETNRPRT